MECAVSDAFDEPEDATPLEPEERAGLVQSWITSRHDLNLAEQDNIIKAVAWARRSRRVKIDALLSADFARGLHKRMFGEVWRWAGQYRTTERNIGVDAWRIAAELPAFFDDAHYWTTHETYAPDEIAIRLHHRLVFIHPFPNGNGRHARLLADMLIERLGGKVFSWGGGQLQSTSELRARYVAALRAADAHDILPLLAFARS
jgi:Fic-DOC domain mobile mystery protein B